MKALTHPLRSTRATAGTTEPQTWGGDGMWDLYLPQNPKWEQHLRPTHEAIGRGGAEEVDGLCETEVRYSIRNQGYDNEGVKL